MTTKNKETKQATLFGDYAIIETGRKQYQAIPGKTIAVEKLAGNPGDTIEFKDVLLRKAGDAIAVGQPHLEKPVKASIIKHERGKKVIAFRFRRRQKVRVKKGHRQEHTVIRIESI